MVYYCSDCGCDRARRDFSTRQLKKEYPRCYDCTQGGDSSYGQETFAFECPECSKRFADANSLAQHRHTHRARSFPCPGCGELYRGMTDAAMHFESGSCNACRGKDAARRAAYDLVANQPGGSRFLTNPRMLTYDGQVGGGYSDSGHNYQCHACGKTFGQLSSFMQHTQNRPACRDGQHVNANLKLTHSTPQPERLRFFHGTTWAKACAIEQQGFVPSESGCLGRGTYVARQDKARRFAEMRSVQTGEPGRRS